jgi:uncharacterized membrane protein (DUF4010 family)
MDLESTLLRLGLALALGWLVGLQRERAASRVAGVRTFALITLLGAVAGLTVPVLGLWLVPAGALALAAVLVIGNVVNLRIDSDPDPGVTTEVAALLMYAVGAYLVVGHMPAAVAVGGAVFLLLHFKEPMHSAIAALGESDMRAIMQFALVTLVVLPILPDRSFGPYDAFNLREIWWMVVLIVSINLAGYVAYKLFGTRRGALLGGLVGGLVSSTATTVSQARRSRDAGPDAKDAKEAKHTKAAAARAGLAALVITLASAVSVLRVLVEIAVVAPSQFAAVAGPLIAMLGWMIALCAAAWLLGRGEGEAHMAERGNPAELKPALVFGALYAVVVLAIAFTKHHFGEAGLYPVALVSGLTDMDAITLSTVNLAAQGRLEPATTWRLILLAGLANITFKGAYACLLGSAALRARIGVLFGLALAGGAAILVLWS